MRATLPILILAVVGCSTNSLGIGARSASQGAEDVDSSTNATEPGAADTGISLDELAMPTFWSIDGELAVLAGEIDAASSSAVVRTWDDMSQAVCAYELTVESSTPAAFDDPDVVMFGWWTLNLSLGIADDARCPDWPATELTLGIGEYDARLDPALHAHGWSSSSVYGLYLQQADGPLYLVGVSGTTAQLDGDQPSEVLAPPGDGIYELHSVVLLDLSR